MSTSVLKSALNHTRPSLWNGYEGRRARAAGVKNEKCFAVFKTIEAEMVRTRGEGCSLGLGDISQRSGLSTGTVERALETLKMDGVVRENRVTSGGLVGRRRFVLVGWDR